MIDYIHERCREDGDCWIWKGGCTSRGVPSMHRAGKVVGVRRVVAEIIGLSIEGRKVTNKCGNKQCVCPDHVLSLTPSALGKLSEKRTGYGKNIVRNKAISEEKRKHHAKINEEIAREIRESDETLRAVAARVGISLGVAGKIRAGKIWKTYTASPFRGLGAR